MFNAHIEMDLNQHISVLSSKIIQIIQVGDEVILESLMRRFLKKYKYYTPDQFMDGMAFLFSIDCLTVQDYKVIIKNV